MKIFQFYFNPFYRGITIFSKSKKKPAFESFCYEPSQKQEEDLGFLCMVAEMEISSAKEKRNLKRLIESVKNEYYSSPERGLEESFRECLRRIGPEEIPKNLNGLVVFAVDKNFSCLFSKIGELKIILCRGGEIFNIGDNASFNSVGAKIFSNVMRGDLTKGDRLFILNKELFDQLWAYKLFKKFKYTKKPRQIKKIFKEKKEILKGLQGVLVFIHLDGKWKKIYFNLPRLKIPGLRINRHKIIRNILPQSPILREKIKKGFISFIILLAILLFGYLIF